MVDASGNIMVEYKYDAWGKIIGRTDSLVSTLGYLNPFRYRGYVYDEETGLYYLRSRYYNPEWGRFVNADVLLGKQGALLSHNLFAYCRNNPISMTDENGRSPGSILAAIAVATMIVKTAKIVVPAIGAEAQLVVNRLKAKKALQNSRYKQNDYLINYPYGGAENAAFEGFFW